jgi:hypothetical protein
MYYIINRTTNQTTTHYGNFPDVDDLLNGGDDIIIISLYSNTIKVPYKEYDDNWGWKDYNASFLLQHDDDPKDIDYPEDEEYAHGEDECYDYDEHTSVITDERDYEQELHPEYIIASTNLMMQETMVFCADADGHITSFGGLNSIALRYGQEYWEDAFAAVVPLNTNEHQYIYVRTLESDKNVHNLFKRVNTLDLAVI